MLIGRKVMLLVYLGVNAGEAALLVRYARSLVVGLNGSELNLFPRSAAALSRAAAILSSHGSSLYSGNLVKAFLNEPRTCEGGEGGSQRQECAG